MLDYRYLSITICSVVINYCSGQRVGHEPVQISVMQSSWFVFQGSMQGSTGYFYRYDTPNGMLGMRRGGGVN